MLVKFLEAEGLIKLYSLLYYSVLLGGVNLNLFNIFHQQKSTDPIKLGIKVSNSRLLHLDRNHSKIINS